MKNLSALLKKSKERRAQGLFVVEGPKMCFEAPKEWVRAVYVSETFEKEPDTRTQLFSYCGEVAQALPYEVVADSVLKSVSDTQNPQGIMAVVEKPCYTLSDMLCGEQTMLLVLDGIQDPGNLGTMLRTGEGAGMTGVIMSRTTVDLFNPKTIRSTMGSLYRVPFYIAENLVATLAQLKADGVKLYAAHLKGTRSYDEPDYTGACGFLIGNEGNGLSEEAAEAADTYIRIPMAGQVESLNAAISAGLLLYECSRQRRQADRLCTGSSGNRGKQEL
jgi:TrmH family RNA methyltransferase